MSVELLRLWADRLRDPSEGVNARLLAMPRDGTDPAPRPVSVIEETEYFWSAAEKVPAKILEARAPFLWIARASPETLAQIPGAPELADQAEEIDLMALYLGVADAGPGNGPHQLMRDAMYTMRALRRCTAEWVDDASSAAYAARARNGVQLVRIVRAATLNLAGPVTGGFVGAGFVVGFECTDRWTDLIADT